MQGVAFRMLKKGNKGRLEAQNLVVPTESSLGVQAQRSSRKGAESDAAIIKAKVLQYVSEREERTKLVGHENCTYVSGYFQINATRLRLVLRAVTTRMPPFSIFEEFDTFESL
jgi:hypothetical protein